MGMIRRLNLTQSVFVLGEIELIVRFLSPHAPLKMARPDVFYVFLKKKICGKKCEHTKNQKYLAFQQSVLLSLFERPEKVGIGHVDYRLIPVMFVYHRDTNVFMH